MTETFSSRFPFIFSYYQSDNKSSKAPSMCSVNVALPHLLLKRMKNQTSAFDFYCKWILYFQVFLTSKFICYPKFRVVVCWQLSRGTKTQNNCSTQHILSYLRLNKEVLSLLVSALMV